MEPSAETCVWIARCLCGPNRHTILADADLADSEDAPREMLTQLREAVAARLRSGLNPWCEICGVQESGWCYELSSTRFRTMEDAIPELAKMEDSNAVASVLCLHRQRA